MRFSLSFTLDTRLERPMLKRPLSKEGVTAGVLAVLGTLVLLNANAPARIRAEEAKAGGTTPAPVESDMHEFMEYVFQPTYNRLRSAMATDPSDNAQWKAIKADSLSLAEAGNLLLMRAPEDDAAVWNEYSAAVREAGGRMYAASKQKDAKATREHYVAMLKKCNACHDKFAGGEHQLMP
jgi:hypothetical protein